MRNRDVDLVYEEDPSARKGLSDGEAWFGTPVWLVRELGAGKVVAGEIAGTLSDAELIFLNGITAAVDEATCGWRYGCLITAGSREEMNARLDFMGVTDRCAEATCLNDANVQETGETADRFLDFVKHMNPDAFEETDRR